MPGAFDSGCICGPGSEVDISANHVGVAAQSGLRPGALFLGALFALAMLSAAAPLISSVQKLVLYETRAVST